MTSTSSSESSRPDFGDELEREVGLAVGEAAAHGGADAGGDLRVDRVEVDADVQERRPVQERQRLAKRALDAVPVDLAHREDPEVEVADQLALAVVERADADERRPLDGRRRPGGALELRAGDAEGGRERHAVDVPARRGLGAVQVAVRIEPEHAAGPGRRRHPADRPDRDRVIAAEDQRDEPAGARPRDERCDALAGALDRRQVAGVRIAGVGRLGDVDLDVAPVDADAPEPRDPLLEAGVADRRGPHVHPTPPGPEIQPSADHGHGPQAAAVAHRSTVARGQSRPVPAGHVPVPVTHTEL